MQSTDKITFHVISHTHWDREWYLPFEVFRIELVELIDNLLDILEQNSKFIFHLDGQTIILSDYLEIKPQNREKLKKYIKSGNILIGPWYVLSDQFLSSGESTIRNLMYGSRDSKEFGNPMSVGYLPDQFGQIAQLPQILKGFNINCAIVGRGIQDGIAEHRWYGLNGDSVLTISLTHWYNNAQRLPEINSEEYLNKIFEKQNKTALSGNILLMNGCDHLFPQGNLTDVLNKLNTSDKYSIIQSSLENTFKEIENSGNTFPVRYGELRDDNDKQILSGTLSSRVYLKLENYKVQTKIEKILEPLATIVHLVNKTKYPFEGIKHAWKLLIQNHAHDSICGCSIDEVHKEMETRYLKVNQIVEKLIQNIKNQPEKEYGENQFFNLINLTAYKRNELVEAMIDIPLGPISTDPGASPKIEKEIDGFKLLDDKDEINFEILETSIVEDFVLSRNEVPLLQAAKRFKILLNITMEPFSAKTFKILPSENKQNTKQSTFKNLFFNFDLQKNGSFDISFNNSDIKFNKLHFMTIEDDSGDEYNFDGKNNKAKPSEVKLSNISIVEESETRKKIILKHDTNNDLDIASEITLYKHSRRVDFKTQIFNHLKNKRIRIHFPTNLHTSYISADTPFGHIQRTRSPIDWKNCAYTQPLYNFIDHNNEKYGLSFFGGGLASYELYKDGNGFSVDLIRAVERLSSVHSHFHLLTPDAQCNRPIEFNYSIYLHDEDESDIQKEQLKYQVPVISYQAKEKIEFEKLLNVPSELVLSSFKRSEDSENMYVLRLFNPSDSSINTKLDLNFPFKKVFLLNLNEEIEKTYDLKKQLNLDVKQHQVITIGIEI